MREVKVVKPCPVCKVDIADCLRSVAVNTGMAETISQLQRGAGGEDGADGEATDGDDPDDGTQEVRQPLCAATQCHPPDSCARPAQPPNPGAASAPKPSAAEVAAAGNAKAVEALFTEFAEYDRSLIEGMLEDQGGDIPEVQAALRRMRNQARLAKRKADSTGGARAAKRSKP